MTRPVALYYRILKYQPENLATLAREFDLAELDSPAQDTPDLLSRVEVLFAPLGYQVDAAKIDACPRLKAIVSNTTGHPHIDVEHARRKGVFIACLKFAPEFLKRITPTAEHTWGLLLALTRNLVPAHRAALAGTWDRRPFGGRAMLSSMSLGIAGHGRLGGMVARYGAAFGMKVRYYDPYVEASAEGAERVATLEELVECSDVVSIHVPHEKETEGMFSAEVFARFRPGSWLVNTARGELVDWNALLAALESGRLAGAALDVFEDEFAPGFAGRFPAHPLLAYARRHDNLLLTPHIGGSTVDAWRLTEAHAIEMALAHLRSLHR
ncbi:NAD(P)-dependent oxidoreductase [Ramlibacter sp.]|uniref:NAD(P)-dependent oxidoreductase n=1 Tax=Ramlibacter sp. TaxID=1917967 RepID=UPI002D6915AC|nr:NAD(P)-dependent oxidoreductase [Ramlibacter sp.]HYD74998.1 NAD(P)-dependent oxidoreductase [Ramlibacter sp.]